MANPPNRLYAATARHMNLLTPLLRREHTREIADTCGLSPKDALAMSLASSVEAYVLEDRDGGPVFAMGVEPRGLVTGRALVWMVGAAAINRHAVSVMRAARWGIARAFVVTGADALEQYIPAWYWTGVRFALRLGFRLAEQTRCRDNAIAWRVEMERREHRS